MEIITNKTTEANFRPWKFHFDPFSLAQEQNSLALSSRTWVCSSQHLQPENPLRQLPTIAIDLKFTVGEFFGFGVFVSLYIVADNYKLDNSHN